MWFKELVRSKKMLKIRNYNLPGNGGKSTGKPIWIEKKQTSENENAMSVDLDIQHQLATTGLTS